MHSVRKQRLLFIALGLVLLSLGVASVLYALRDNINLFFTPTEVQQGLAAGKATIRIGGLVQNGSIERGQDVLVRFAVTDTKNTVQVHYRGILPDLFQENEGVVVIGTLNHEGTLVASEVLAKHDENYMPPEAMEAIRRANEAERI